MSQQGLDFTKKSVVGPGRQKVPKSDFKVNFLCQKSFESFWMFFFHYWISVLKKDFCYFLQNSIVKPLCFLKWFPVFDGLCEHLWKSNQIFFFTDFLLKSTSCWLMSAKLYHWDHTTVFLLAIELETTLLGTFFPSFTQHIFLLTLDKYVITWNVWFFLSYWVMSTYVVE